MSTLVEAVSVVIPRHVLDVSYPGGCDAYLEGARRTRGVRFVVADARLTCVSLPTLDDATAFVRPLEAIGLTTPDGRPLAIACVDEHFGPTAPAPWLRWRRHDEGYTSCWLEWTEPGELVLPDVRLDGDDAEASSNGTGSATDEREPEPFDPFATPAGSSADEGPTDGVAAAAGEVFANADVAADVAAAFEAAPVAIDMAIDLAIGAMEATVSSAVPEEDRLESEVADPGPEHAPEHVESVLEHADYAWEDLVEAASADAAEQQEPEAGRMTGLEGLPEFEALPELDGEVESEGEVEPAVQAESVVEVEPEPEAEPDEAVAASEFIPATMEELSVTTVLDMTPTPTDAPAVTLLDAVRAGLDRQGWRHGVDAAQGAAFFQVPGWRATYAGSAYVDEAGLARVYTDIPVRVPEDRRAATVELLTRVNHGLPVGNFEFDHASGEVRFKATADCGPHITPDAIDRLLQLGVAACDRVHDPMMQVIYGGVAAEAAIGGDR